MSSPETTAPGLPSAKHLALVLLVCAAVYWPLLGATGFSSTEGHRVIPGWEMLETGNFLVTRMFDQIYVRKPPGMPWAVALSSAIFGQTEFAARAVSAASMTILALLSTFFAARWFGRRWAIWGGIATALTPLFWSSGRSAEIEALNNFATAAAVLFLIDLLVRRTDSPRSRAAIALLAAGAIGLTALAKGPAGFASIGAAIVASCIVLRSAKPLLRRGLWVAAATPAILLLGLFVLIQQAVEQSGQVPVVEDVGNFLWKGHGISVGAVMDVALMAPSALFTALPAALALLLVWKQPEGEDAHSQLASRAARAIALTCLLSLGLLVAMGVNNPRYAMPSFVFVPVLAAYIARGAAGGFTGKHLEWSRALVTGRGYLWLGTLLLAAAAFIVLYQHDRRMQRSGLEAGIALAPHLPDGALVWADHLIEARPEVLLYAQRTAATDGRRVEMRWMPGFAAQNVLPATGAYLLIRNDAGSDELQSLADLHHRLEQVATGQVHKFKFILLRITAE